MQVRCKQIKKSLTALIFKETFKNRECIAGEISSDLDGTKKMMENLNIIQISHLTFDCS